jgi:solute carrier family 25 citrate transporter 1
VIQGTIAKDAIRFMSFDAVKEAFKDPETGTLSPLRNILAGMASGVVASTLAVTPTERLKTALIDDARTEKRFKSAWHATTTLVKEKGLRALYRGYITTTAKQMGTTSVRLGSYNIMKDYGKLHNWPENSFVDFGKGMIAGTVTTYATQPIDVVKTRAQSVKGAGVVEATMSVWQDYGIKGFWRGTVMRLGRTVMAGGILFTSYEQIVTLVKPLVVVKEREEI